MEAANTAASYWFRWNGHPSVRPSFFRSWSRFMRGSKPNGQGNRPLALTYSRVSNPNDLRDASLDSQEEATVEMLESRGYEVPHEYRFREQWTGMESIYDRPVLNRPRWLIESG